MIILNTKNIKPGDCFKSYRDLCKALEIDIKTGNSKKKQMREIESVLRYSKHNYSFKIEEVYQKPRYIISPYENSEVHHFSRNIQIVLLQYLKEHDILEGSIVQLCKLVGLLGENYDCYDEIVKFTNKYPNISLQEIRMIKNKAYMKAANTLNYALHRLETNQVISYERKYKITTIEGEAHIACEDEIEKIKDIRDKVLSSFKVDSIQDLYIQGNINQYYYLLKKECSWKQVKRMIHIRYLCNYTLDIINPSVLDSIRSEVNSELLLYLNEREKDKRGSNLIIDSFISL